MKIWITWVSAIMLVCGVSFGQTVSEKTITRTSSDGVTTEKTTTYESRTEAAYRSIGVPTETIIKLRDYDSKIREARLRGDTTIIKQYYDAQTALLTPDQITRVRAYLTANPVTTGDKIVTYWEEVPTVVREVRPATSVVTTREVPVVTREVRVQPAEVRTAPAPSTTIRSEETTVKTTTSD